MVTQKECQEKLVTAAVQSKTTFENQYAPCTYLVKDYSFSRNHVDVGAWLGVTASGTTQMVNSQGEMSVPSSTNLPSVNYYIGNGYEVNDSNQATYGGQ